MSRIAEAVRGLTPLRCALLLAVSTALACQCVSSFRIGPGGARVDFQGCPPHEVRDAVAQFEAELGKRKPPDESRIRAEAFVLLNRIQRLVDKPSKITSGSETREQIESVLVKLRALPVQGAVPNG